MKSNTKTLSVLLMPASTSKREGRHCEAMTERVFSISLRYSARYLLGLLADVSQDAAISVQDLAVDKVGSVGSQEHAGAHHVLGGAPAACGGLGADEGIEGMAAAIGLDLAQGSGLSGGNVAGAHAVALDVVLAVLGGDVAGQHLQCALGGSVGG